MLNRLDTPTKSNAFDLFMFLEGKTLADGVFEDRGGRLKRRFVVQTMGRSDGRSFILDESFRFDDGEEMQRTWTMERGEDGRFTGTCPDAFMPALGRVGPDLATMQSTLLLTVGTRKIAVNFNDVFYPVDDSTVLNRSTLSKWGFTIGQVLIVFRKPQRNPS